MAFDLTREGIKPAAGMYAVVPNLPQDHNVIFYAEDETATIAAGYAVQLSSTSTNTAAPVVEATTAASDIPYGFVVYDALKDEYAVGARIAIAKTGDVIYLPASAAIEVGAYVQFDPTTGEIATAESGNAQIGVANTVATAEGDLVQVALNLNLGLAE